MPTKQATPTIEWKNRIVGHGEKRASEFTANPLNWRKHPTRQKNAVVGSLNTLGWIDTVIINRTTGRVIDGHERIEEALANGDAMVPYIEVELTEAEEAQALLTLDATAALATADRNNIEQLLSQIQTTDTDVTNFLKGFANDHGLDWGAEDDADDGQPEIDRAALLQEKWKTELGQTWLIGPHKIICGDSTDPDTWTRLMGGEKANCNFQDPPYGVDYEDSDGESIKGDDLKDNDLITKLLKPAWEQAMKHTVNTAAFYIFHPSATRRDFEWTLDAVGLEEKQYLIWVKQNAVLGRADYHWQHEPFFYCQKAGEHADYYGNRKQSTCWWIRSATNDSQAIALANGVEVSDGTGARLYIAPKVPKGKKTRLIRLTPGQTILINQNDNSTAWEIHRDAATEYLHPTQKPVGLARRAILNSTQPGEIVVDQFLGGAATLVAAEATGRKCRGMELDPKYIAVALERMSAKFPELPIRQEPGVIG